MPLFKEQPVPPHSGLFLSVESELNPCMCVLIFGFISFLLFPSQQSPSLVTLQISAIKPSQDVMLTKNITSMLLKITFSPVTSTYLHLKKFLFIFLQRFNFLLRERNYRLKLGVVVGLICILSRGIMVLMRVLCRKMQRGDAAGWRTWPTAGIPNSEWHPENKDRPHPKS